MESGGLEAWKPRSVGVLEPGSLGTWELGSLGAWEPGSLERCDLVFLLRCSLESWNDWRAPAKCEHAILGI